MASTKKLLVRFDIAKKDPVSGDFLIPRNEEGKLVLRAVKSGKIPEYGMMVYIGVEVKENDLFAKPVDSGTLISRVDDTMASLRKYIEQLQTLRIGNVVRIIPANGTSDTFALELVAMTPSASKR